MPKIKIVYLLGSLHLGGTERQFIELVQRIDRSRFDIRVLAFHRQGHVRTVLESLNIPFATLNFYGLKGKYRPTSYLKLYRLLRDIVRYLKQERPQIVQSFLYWANVYGSIAATLAGVPVIITGRRATMETKYKKFPGQWFQNVSNLLATTIISNSEAVKQECLQHDRWVSGQKISVIYNGLASERYAVSIDVAAQKAALHIPENAQVVGIIASLQPRKRHQDFLQAAAQVLQTYPQTIFLIVGRDNGSRSELERLTTELGIEDAVIFSGERADIPEILAILDVQVLCSSVEGLSNALLEGMSAGKPIIASRVAGNPELVLHEQTGLLVPLAEPDALAQAIICLLRDKTLRDKMGQAGQQRVAELFQMDRMIRDTQALYQQLVDRRL